MTPEGHPRRALRQPVRAAHQGRAQPSYPVTSEGRPRRVLPKPVRAARNGPTQPSCLMNVTCLRGTADGVGPCFRRVAPGMESPSGMKRHHPPGLRRPRAVGRANPSGLRPARAIGRRTPTGARPAFAVGRPTPTGVSPIMAMGTVNPTGVRPAIATGRGNPQGARRFSPMVRRNPADFPQGDRTKPPIAPGSSQVVPVNCPAARERTPESPPPPRLSVHVFRFTRNMTIHSIHPTLNYPHHATLISIPQ